MLLQNRAPPGRRTGGEQPLSTAVDRQDEHLPFRIELWKGAVQKRVLAATSNVSIGYAAFYAAAKLYPDSYIELRDSLGVLCRWGVREG